MIDPPSAVVLLEGLRAQIPALQSEPPLGESFYRWHREVLDALEKIYGPNSTEEREFQQIRFELDPEMLRRSEEELRASIENRLGITAPEAFEIPLDDYYRRRLIQADEFLFSLVVILRS